MNYSIQTEKKPKREYRTLRLLITNSCSLECNYCCAEGHESAYNHLNSENVSNIISIFNDFFNIERIKLTGGEPLNFKGIIEMISDIFKVKKPNQTVSIVTNGVHTQNIKYLANSFKDIDLTISLPSNNIYTFNKITNHGYQHENVMESLNYLNNANFNYKINCVLVDGITNVLDNIKDLLKEYGLRHNVNLRFLELSVNRINRERLEQHSYSSSQSCFDEIMNTLKFKKNMESDQRESVIYSKDGVIIKYIKFFLQR